MYASEDKECRNSSYKREEIVIFMNSSDSSPIELLEQRNASRVEGGINRIRPVEQWVCVFVWQCCRRCPIRHLEENKIIQYYPLWWWLPNDHDWGHGHTVTNSRWPVANYFRTVVLEVALWGTSPSNIIRVSPSPSGHIILRCNQIL